MKNNAHENDSFATYASLHEWFEHIDATKSDRGPVRINQWFEEKYQLEQILGHGHTSVVFKATDTRLGRPVALKLWNDYQFGIDSSILIREGRLLAQLDHPNIVTVHDYGIDERLGRPWMALEYLGPTTLLDVLRARSGGFGTWSDILNVAAQIASILDFLHNHADIVQVDLKPGNLAFANLARPLKLMDLGSAYLSTDDYLARFGTPGYIAPELFRREVVTKAADVFSLGMVLCELATGVNPLSELQREVFDFPDNADIDWDQATAAIPIALASLQPGGSPYDHLLEKMEKLDLLAGVLERTPPAGFVDLLQDVTSFDQSRRPSAHRVRFRLNEINRPSRQIRPPTVFISHSHKDKERFVTAFAELLQAKGFEIWLDEWNLRVGEPFWDSIARAIEKADFFVVVLSVNSTSSTGVAEEIRTAQLENLDKVKILPVRIDPLDYSEIPAHLRSRHILDFVGWDEVGVFHRKTDKLATDIMALHERLATNGS